MVYELLDSELLWGLDKLGHLQNAYGTWFLRKKLRTKRSGTKKTTEYMYLASRGEKGKYKYH